MLVRVEWTIATTADFDAAQSDRQFNVLVSDYTLATLIPKVLALSRTAGATVRFNFMHQVDGPERLLERGDVDLLIIPKEFCSRQHPFEVILEEEFCAIVWSGGEFARNRLTRRGFAEASHVVMQTPDGAQSLESVFFKQHDLVRRVAVATYNFTTIPLLIVGTDHVATIHRRLADEAARTLPIKILELPYRLSKMQQTLQWHRYRSQDAGLIWLRGVIREAAGQPYGGTTYKTN